MIDGVPVLRAECLIPFKAKAWLDLRERKSKGEVVDSKNIRKHKNDVFRLAQLITENTRKQLDDEAKKDMKLFLEEIQKEPVDFKSLGIRGAGFEAVVNLLRQCYDVKD